MKDLAFDLAPPLETEQPATLLASGPATSDVGQVTVQGYDPSRDTAGGAFVGTRLNTPKAGQAQPTLQDREKLAIGLLDTLAGALRGAAIETVALPGNIRSIVDMINKEGAEKYFGQAVAPTTEDIKKAEGFTLFGQDIPVPPVLGADVPNRAERQKSVEAAEEVGAYLPAPGVPEAVVQGAKLVGKAIKATKGLPVGMSTQAVGEGVDQLGFYSAAKQAVDAIQQPKGTGDQFLKQIEKTPGVKPDEIKWTGLDEFLKSKKSVTKAEVQEYLDKNRVEVKEITLNEGARPYRYVTADEWQGAINDAERVGNFDESERITAAWENFELGAGGNKPKFAKYTLPGGENYREVLLTLPSKQTGKSQIAFKTTEDADNFLTDMSISGFEDMNYGRLNDTNVVEFDGAIPSNVTQMIRNNDGDIIAGKEMAGSTYGSPHFEQPNILAHLRVNDRVDADGKKVLFVEEIQSDWHQAGRKKGYGEKDVPAPTTMKVKEYINPYVNNKGESFSFGVVDNGQLVSGNFRTEAEALAEIERLRGTVKQMGVPDAPFKTTWSELAMKRAIQMASEGGYDRIAFTTGKTQAERFDLSKQIGRVNYTEGGVLRAFDKDGNMVLSKKLDSPDQIEDYIGKEPAKKLMEQEIKGVRVDSTPEGRPIAHGNPNVFDGRELSGVDLSVGGEGMKGFYDDILPKFLNKYAKKWDAKTGITKIRLETDAQAAEDAKLLGELGVESNGKSAASVHYIDITPKMRESVITKGQPMFAIGAGGAGAAATQQEDNK